MFEDHGGDKDRSMEKSKFNWGFLSPKNTLYLFGEIGLVFYRSQTSINLAYKSMDRYCKILLL